MLAFANILFFVFHTLLIVFNVFGWAHPKTRRWNLITLGVTLVSWLGMGMFYGVGYCICTDWHWQIRESMGIHETADSYIVLLVRNVSGWDPPVSLANTWAMWVMVFAVAMSIGTNVRDWRKRRVEFLSTDNKD